MQKYASICQIICQKILHCLYSAYSAYCYMQNMQNTQWNVADIFCILSIFQHIPTYWSSYFLAYSCIFSLLSSQRKLVIESQNTGYISPENRFIVSRQDFFQVLIRQGIISCRFEYDHTIIVTCKWKRKVMICIICIICTKIMNMHNMHIIYKYRVRYLNLQEVCQARTKPHQ